MIIVLKCSIFVGNLEIGGSFVFICFVFFVVYEVFLCVVCFLGMNFGFGVYNVFRIVIMLC